MEGKIVKLINTDGSQEQFCGALYGDLGQILKSDGSYYKVRWEKNGLETEWLMASRFEVIDRTPLESVSEVEETPVFKVGDRISFKNPNMQTGGIPEIYEPKVGSKGTLSNELSYGWKVKWDDGLNEDVYAREDQLDHVIEENASVTTKRSLTYKEFVEEFNFYGGLKPDMFIFDELSDEFTPMPTRKSTLKQRLNEIRESRRNR